MSILKVLLCVLVLASPLLSEASRPNCTGVHDFEACLNNTDEFCPSDVPCQCKNEEPFCRCVYFRVGWQEYWYMGPRCNRLWSTLGFIAVATVPGVALVLIVVAVFSFFYCSKKKKAGAHQASFKDWTQPKTPSSGEQHNPAFSADTDASQGQGHQQAPGDSWVGQIPKVVLKRQDFNDASIPNQRQNYSSVYAQPVRKADPASDYFAHSRAQREEFDYPRKNLPYPDYPDGRQYRRY